MSIDKTFTLAFRHQQAGQLSEAEALCRQILAAEPNHADTLHLLGLIAFQAGSSDHSVELLTKAVAIQPKNPAYYCNLGEVCRRLGRFDQAITAFSQAIQIRPDAITYNNLGLALAERGLLDEAITAYRLALQYDPNLSEVYSNLGNAFKDQGQLDEAIAAYHHALVLNPNNAKTHSNLIYILHYHPKVDEKAIAQEQELWNQQFAEPLKPYVLPYKNEADSQRRLRIGYVSPEFRDHVTGRYLIPLFEHHDHHNFEIICYSGVLKPDGLTEKFQKLTDQWHNVANLTDEALATAIRRDGVDILVDLTQHLSGNRLTMFARQPAPLQVSIAGYPASTGLEAIKYRISDRYLEADLSPSKEHVLCIDSFWCYDPCGAEVVVNALPMKENEHVTFGCLNNFCKINDQVLALWARILGKVKGARLLLLSAASSHRQRTLETLQREGIDSHRIEFVEPRDRKAYLELYHRLDIALDPFPYNGHTTTLDSLWMGVPVISLVRKQAVARAGFSQLSNIGLQDLAAFAEDDYVEIASKLASDPHRLIDLRATLRQRMESSVLMNGHHFASSIETIYRSIWNEWCKEQQRKSSV